MKEDKLCSKIAVAALLAVSFMIGGIVISIIQRPELTELKKELEICQTNLNMPLVLGIYEDIDTNKILACTKYPNCADITAIIKARANQIANIRQTYLLSLIANNEEYRKIACGG